MRKIHLENNAGTLSSATEISPENNRDLRDAGSLSYEGTRHTIVAESRLIMVIDDSPTVRKIIEISLQRKGFTVISFPDGIEALQTITNRQLLPDLVILDIDLPKMNGYEIARYLRSKPQLSRTIIVILSGHDGIIDRIKARLVGTQVYLTKPFTTEMIVDVVSNSLGLSTVSIEERAAAPASAL